MASKHPAPSTVSARTTTGLADAAHRRRRRGLIGLVLAVLLLMVAASLVGWTVSYKAGVSSVQSIGQKIEELYPPKIMAELFVRMEPARVFLQQGLEMLHQYELDPTMWEAHEMLRKYGTSFLLNYFDDAQCCYGYFTRMNYTPGVNEDDFGDDRALFDSVIASKTAIPGFDEVKVVLHELRPTDTSGNIRNEALWVPFNMTNRYLPNPLNLSSYENMGFINFPRDDGVNPMNPESGWYKVIQSRDMQEGDFCFSPIFVWHVNEPITLKIHGIVPVWAGDASQRERVGAFVVGFKLHFLDSYLAALNEKGGSIFVVERDTGFIISSSNMTMPCMSVDYQTIHTNDAADDDIACLARHIAPDRDWSTVEYGHLQISTHDGVSMFVFVEQYSYHCLDWIVVVAIPKQTVLAGINSLRVTTIVASVTTPLAMLVVLLVVLVAVFIMSAWMSMVKSTKHSGPPGEGEMVTLVITDIQGSNSLWDAYPDQVARDIVVHHQCLRSALAVFHGYEVATEGDSFKCAFRTPEDAVCWSMQVQYNLLSAPWSTELEDGGDHLLKDNSDWANTGCSTLPDRCTPIILGMTSKNSAGAFCLKVPSNKNDRTLPPLKQLFDVNAASKTTFSTGKCTEAPKYTVLHSETNCALPLFRGLRVRIGIHTGEATHVSIHESTKRVTYGGRVLEMAKAISDISCGGQIIMSGEALAQITSMHDLMLRANSMFAPWQSGLEKGPKNDEIKSSLSVIHLGSHVFLKLRRPTFHIAITEPSTSLHSFTESEQQQPQTPTSIQCTRSLQDSVAGLLTSEQKGPFKEEQDEQQGEIQPFSVDTRIRHATDIAVVVPWPLRARALFYPALPPKDVVTCPFYQAPSTRGVTILFTFIENWTQLKHWEEEFKHTNVITESLQEYNLTVRTLLQEHRGYEVEGEDGSYVCAFQVSTDALEFASHLQEALLQVNWNPLLLTTPWACEQLTSGGQYMFRGLRTAVGMCTGDALRAEPSLRTGRIEYYGPIMNHAARVAVATHGGQVLIHENTILSLSQSDLQVLDLLPMSFTKMGEHKIKGISKPVMIHQLASDDLAGRLFPPIKTKTNQVVQRPNCDSNRLTAYAHDHNNKNITENCIGWSAASTCSQHDKRRQSFCHTNNGTSYTSSLYEAEACPAPSTAPLRHHTLSSKIKGMIDYLTN